MALEAEMNGKELYLRLLTYVKPYWKAFALALVCMGASALAEPAFPALLKYLLDDGFASQQGSYDFLMYPAALFAIFFVRVYYMGVISTLFPNLDSGTMLPAVGLGIGLFLLVSVCNIIAIHRKITAIWQRKE